jgi:class 3 adenylate cyclase
MGSAMNKPGRLFKFVEQSLESGYDLDALDAELDQRFGETCAALVMDSTGFTRTTETRGPAYFLSIICLMRRVCDEISNRFNPVATRAQADNFYAEFGSVDDAVAAAFAIHRHFEDHPISLVNDSDKFGGCIGIGFGRVLRSEYEGVYGNEMKYAAKLGEDIAERGETLLTEAAFRALSHPESYRVTTSSRSISGVTMAIYSLRPGP